MAKLNLLLLLVSFQITFVDKSFAGEGHDAGRQWAESHGIDDPDNCRSAQPGRWENDNINNSRSFTEGCLEHLREEGVTNEEDELVSKKDESDADNDELNDVSSGGGEEDAENEE